MLTLAGGIAEKIIVLILEFLRNPNFYKESQDGIGGVYLPNRNQESIENGDLYRGIKSLLENEAEKLKPEERVKFLASVCEILKYHVTSSDKTMVAMIHIISDHMSGFLDRGFIRDWLYTKQFKARLLNLYEQDEYQGYTAAEIAFDWLLFDYKLTSEELKKYHENIEHGSGNLLNIVLGMLQSGIYPEKTERIIEVDNNRLIEFFIVHNFALFFYKLFSNNPNENQLIWSSLTLLDDPTKKLIVDYLMANWDSITANLIKSFEDWGTYESSELDEDGCYPAKDKFGETLWKNEDRVVITEDIDDYNFTVSNQDEYDLVKEMREHLLKNGTGIFNSFREYFLAKLYFNQSSVHIGNK